MTCLRAPLSLEDAQLIIECYGGPDWRSAFVLGLATVAVIGVVLALGYMGLRGTGR